MLNRVSSNWGSAVLICKKCTKKVDGGFGDKGRTSLAKLLKHEIGKGRKASLGVIEVKCLGICPKNAVTVIDSRKPGEWMVVRAGTPVAQVKALLTE